MDVAVHVFLETRAAGTLPPLPTGDVDNLVGLDADPDVMRFVSGGIPTSRDEIENEFLPAFLGYYQRYQTFGFWAAESAFRGRRSGTPGLAVRSASTLWV